MLNIPAIEYISILLTLYYFMCVFLCTVFASDSLRAVMPNLHLVAVAESLRSQIDMMKIRPHWEPRQRRAVLFVRHLREKRTQRVSLQQIPVHSFRMTWNSPRVPGLQRAFLSGYKRLPRILHQTQCVLHSSYPMAIRTHKCKWLKVETKREHPKIIIAPRK